MGQEHCFRGNATCVAMTLAYFYFMEPESLRLPSCTSACSTGTAVDVHRSIAAMLQMHQPHPVLLQLLGMLLRMFGWWPSSCHVADPQCTPLVEETHLGSPARLHALLTAQVLYPAGSMAAEVLGKLLDMVEGSMAVDEVVEELLRRCGTLVALVNETAPHLLERNAYRGIMSRFQDHLAVGTRP
jgi:hypothetical protein